MYSLGGVRARPLSRAYTVDKTPRTQKSNASLSFIVFCCSSMCWSTSEVEATLVTTSTTTTHHTPVLTPKKPVIRLPVLFI